MLVLFRVLQGAAGGGLQPSEQSILADTFPPQKRSMAFAVYGMAVVLAPVLGPTVGGWIVDNYSWRWIFFLNIPVGIVSLYLTNRARRRPALSRRNPQAQGRHRLLGPRPARRHHRRAPDHARQRPGRRLVRLPLHRHLRRRRRHRTGRLHLARALTSSIPSSTCASSPGATSA